jgi:polysaccharide biosynthesis protein PslH
MASKQILFLAAHLPVLGHHGGGMRMFHNLRILAQKWQVTLISFYENENELKYLLPLQKLGIEVHPILRRPCPPSHWLIPLPYEHDEYASAQMRREVRKALETREYSAVQVEYIQMGQHVPASFRGRKILTEHEIHFANFFSDFQAEKRVFRKLQKAYEWLVQLNYETKVCGRFDRIVCMTQEDAERLARYVPKKKICFIPIGVDCSYFSPSPPLPGIFHSPVLLFVGNYRHPPNREAVTYFARQIFPLVRNVVPDAVFRVAGANSNLLEFADLPGIQMTGYLDDLRSIYASAKVFVAPILSGNGMRVKLLEAMAMGMPVVSTPLAASGFCAKNGDHLLLAGGPAEFAVKTVRLLQEDGLRQQLGQNARGLMESHYSWEVIGQQFLDLMEDAHE